MCAISPGYEGNPDEQGFTLLEVLIALALLGVLAGALYGSYFALIKGRESAVAGMEARRELRLTLDQFRRELSAVIYNKSDKKLSFVVEDRDIFGKPASSLAFAAITAPKSGGTPLSDQVVLRYQVVNSSGKMLLSRQEADYHYSAEPLRYPQIEHLEGFLVECLNGDKWVKSWDTAINFGLPKAVRITITVMEGGNPVEYSTIATPRIAVS